MAKKKQDDEWLSWGLIIFLFIIGLSPVALILLFVKLFGDDTKKVRASGSGRPAQKEQTSKAAAAVKKVTKSPRTKKSTAKWLKIAGLVLIAVGLIACVEPIDMMI